MSEEEKKKLVLDNISKEALVDRVMFFFEREKYYRERTYDLEEKINKAIEYIKENCTNYYVEKPNYRGIELINIEELLEILGDKENE